ncbi:MAG: NAD(P)H-binding protein [Frankia sp.]
MNVLIVGATGKTGRFVVEAVLARGHGVRAASRSPAPTRDGVTPVVFDWEDKSTWAAVAGDAQAMYLVGPGKLADPGHRVSDLLTATPGVRRVVVLSDMSAGAIDDGTSPKLDVERAVRRSGKEWTVLRSNWFHQNFTEISVFTAAMDARDEIVAPAGGARVSFIDAADTAEVAAVTLTTDGHDGQTYVLTGPQALTFGQVAAELTNAGRSVHHVDPPSKDMAVSLAGMDLPAPLIPVIGPLFQQIRDGVNSPVTDTVEKITGRPARSLASFLAATVQENA